VAWQTLVHRAPRRPLPPAETRVQRPQAVAALGRLEPAGDIRVLAAPSSTMGGTPRITELRVAEGDRVASGQMLARFDTAVSQLAERGVLVARIGTLQRRLTVENRELERYSRLAGVGAIAVDELDRRSQDHLLLQGELQEAKAELAKIEADLANTELRAPIAGTVLRINARVGERPGERGILELGASDRMEALLEVYESDVARVRPGMAVQLSSENGGFSGILRGRVSRISPQVRQRQVLSTDPTGDADARIVEVRVSLEPDDAQRVRQLTGLKVIARLGS
jgi:HlyD family secretion protein